MPVEREKRYRPVFVGRTKQGEKVEVFTNADTDTEKYLRYADGELWSLAPGSVVTMGFNTTSAELYLTVTSDVWSGQATGTRKDLVDAGWL